MVDGSASLGREERGEAGTHKYSAVGTVLGSESK